MKIGFSFKKVLKGLKRGLKKTGFFVASSAFLFFFLLFTVEVIAGVWLYYNFCFPQEKIVSFSGLRLKRDEFRRALIEIEKEEKAVGGIEEKEYLPLFTTGAEEEEEKEGKD